MEMYHTTVPVQPTAVFVSGYHETSSSSDVGGQRTSGGSFEDTFPANASLKDNDVVKWLRNYEQVCKSKGWSSERMLSSVSCHLGASARTWFENHKTELKTWRIFKWKIIANFGKEDQRIISERLLQTRVQLSTETVLEYIRDVLRLCDEIDPRMPELTRVEHIIRGLSDVHLLSDIVGNPPKSVVKLMERYFSMKKDLFLQSTPIVKNVRSQQAPPSMVISNSDHSSVHNRPILHKPEIIYKSNQDLVLTREPVIPCTTSSSFCIKNDELNMFTGVKAVQKVSPLPQSNKTCVRNQKVHSFPSMPTTPRQKRRWGPLSFNPESKQTLAQNDKVQRVQSLNDLYSNLVRLTNTGKLQLVPLTNSNLIVKDKAVLEGAAVALPTTATNTAKQQVPESPDCHQLFRNKCPPSIPSCNKEQEQGRIEDSIAATVEKTVRDRTSVMSLSTEEHRALIRDVVRDIVKEEIFLTRTNPQNSVTSSAVLEQDIAKLNQPSSIIATTRLDQIPCLQKLYDQSSSVVAIDHISKLDNQPSSTVLTTTLDQAVLNHQKFYDQSFSVAPCPTLGYGPFYSVDGVSANTSYIDINQSQPCEMNANFPWMYPVDRCHVPQMPMCAQSYNVPFPFYEMPPAVFHPSIPPPPVFHPSIPPPQIPYMNIFPG